MSKLKPRTERKAKKWAKKMEDFKTFQKTIYSHGQEIMASPNFRLNKTHIQHGNVTVNEHCFNVARTSLRMKRALRVKCDEKELVRGALLHDYFLYDWHIGEKAKPWQLHGFYHPGIALRNAQKEYELSEIEKDIIKKHMWPLTPVPPTHKAGWIVTCADKWCSLMETFHVYKGHGPVKLEEKED